MNVFQCVAVYCSVLQRVAVCCSVFQCDVVRQKPSRPASMASIQWLSMSGSVLQCAAVCCSVLQYVAACCSVVAVCYSALQCVAAVLVHCQSMSGSGV